MRTPRMGVDTELQELLGTGEEGKKPAPRSAAYHLCCTRLGLAVFVCTLGSSFPFGYSIGVVNAPQTVVESFLNTTYYRHTGQALTQEDMSLRWSVIVSVWAVGGLVGAPATGAVANRLGRRGGLAVSSVVTVVAGLLMVLSRTVRSYELLVVGRLLAGLQCGVGMGVGPLYLTEISPLHLRGLVGALNQVIIVLAINVSQFLGLKHVLGSHAAWHYLFGVVAVPSMLTLVMLPFCPESPRYLYHHQDSRTKALQALQWLHTDETAAAEMRLIEREKSASPEHKFRVFDLLRSPPLRAALLVSVVLHLSQQLSGINAAVFYSTSIFLELGMPLHKAQGITLGLGAVLVGLTVCSALVMDHVGRRPLHLVGLAVMALSALSITISQVIRVKTWSTICFSVVGVFGYIIGFAIGPGSIPWLLVPELFQQEARGAAMSVAVLTNWLGTFTVGISFPVVQIWLGSYCFLPFVLVTIAFWVYLFLYLPETKNRSVDDVTAEFHRRTAPRTPM